MKKKSAHERDGRRGHHRLRRWTIVAAILLLIYTIGGFLAVPWLIRSVGVSWIENRLNGQVTLTRAAFNPYTFGLLLEGLEVTDADGARVVACEQFDGNFQLFASVFRSGWHFKHVLVNRPFVRGEIADDGSVNLIDLVKTTEKPADASPGERLEEIPHVVVGKFAVVESRIEFRDDTTPVPFERLVEDLTFQLDNLDTNPESENPLRLVGTTGAGGTLLWEGTFFADPLSSSGRLALGNMDLTKFMPYLMTFTDGQVTAGRLSVDLTYDFDPVHRPRRATVDIENAVVESLRVEHDDASILDVPKVEISDARADADARSLEVRRVEVTEPSVTVRREASGELEVMTLLTDTPWTAERTGDASGRVDPQTIEYPFIQVLVTIQHLVEDIFGPWSIGVDEIAVNDAIADFTDASTPDPVALHLSQVYLEAGPTRSEDGYRAPFTLTTTVGDGGRLEASGEASLADRSIRADVSAGGVAFAPLSPYLPRELPEPLPGVDHAKATVELDGTWTGQSLGDKRITTEWSGHARLTGVGVRGTDGSDALLAQQVDLEGEATLKLNPGVELLRWKGTSVVDGVRLDAPLRGPVRLSADRLGADGELEFTLPPGGDPDVRFVGDAHLDTLELAAREINDASVRLDEAAANGIDLDHGRRSLSIDEIIARGPGVSAVADLLTASAGASEEPVDRSIDLPYLVRVGHVLVEGAAAELRHGGGGDPFTLNASDATVEISGLVSDGATPAEFSITSKVQSGQVRITGTADAFRDAPYGDLQVQVTALPLKPHEPLVAKYLGYEVERGRLTATIPLTVEDNVVSGEVEFEFDGFHLGSKVDSPDAPDAPIKLGLDLLRDGNDRISGTLPVSGDLNDPSFSIGGLISKAFVNMLGNVAAAPFNILGGLFGAGEEQDLSQVLFEPGQATAGADAISTLDVLARALNERPALSLEAVGHYSDADETALRPVILRENLLEEVREREQSIYSLTDEKYAVAIRVAYRREFEVPDGTEPPPLEVMEPAMFERTEVPVARLVDLAQRRVDVVVGVLVKDNAVPADRVSGSVATGESARVETPSVAFELR